MPHGVNVNPSYCYGTLAEGADEVHMSLRIRHYKNGQSTDELWSGTLTDAQDAFCQRVRDGAVDRVEIRTADDNLIFYYPLEMHVTNAG